MRRTKLYFATTMLAAVLSFQTGCGAVAMMPIPDGNGAAQTVVTMEEIPAYSGSPYVELKGNVPDFSEEELTTEAFEIYSELDSLGRCGVAYANICQEIMPTEKRGSIGPVKPTGWHTVKYNDLIEGNYLYNRCHLIGYQLAGENANEKNLITGTRYFNVTGMLPFENMVDDYVEETGNHVLFRVTPVFEGDNLVASGVVMEAKSVEDEGKGVSFHVYVYNVQPGIVIDYATGESYVGADGTDSIEDAAEAAGSGKTYILNTSSLKIHLPSCSSAADMDGENKEEYTGQLDELTKQGYVACKRCKP